MARVKYIRRLSAMLCNLWKLVFCTFTFCSLRNQCLALSKEFSINNITLNFIPPGRCIFEREGERGKEREREKGREREGERE